LIPGTEHWQNVPAARSRISRVPSAGTYVVFAVSRPF
jgi:hypothetical protein